MRTMSGFDDAGIFFSDNFGGDDEAGSQVGGDKINRGATKKRFKDFIRQVHDTFQLLIRGNDLCFALYKM